MKKVFAALVIVCMGLTAFGQRSNINSAYMSLKNKEYQEALKYINEAVNDPSTKDDPKAWMYRGNIYMAMQNDPGYKEDSPYKEAVSSYLKVVELKPNYEEQQVNTALYNGAFYYYQEALESFNSEDFGKAYNLAGQTVYIGNLDGGKRFEKYPSLDTIVAVAQTIQAMSAYNQNDFEKAEPALIIVKDNPIESREDIYLLLAELYRKNEQNKKELAILTEARQKYPSNTNIRNLEINYYVRTKQQDLLIKKLEEAVASEPDNALYRYNLGKAFMGMAFPEDNSEIVEDKYKMFVLNAEKGYLKAIELAPSNVSYHYDMGVLYYNQAAKITNKMNDLGRSDEDDKLYKELETVRNGLFAKALPELQQVYDAFKTEPSSLSTEEKVLYQSTLVSIYEIYARQNKAEKAAEVKADLEALK